MIVESELAQEASLVSTETTKLARELAALVSYRQGGFFRRIRLTPDEASRIAYCLTALADTNERLNEIVGSLERSRDSQFNRANSYLDFVEEARRTLGGIKRLVEDYEPTCIDCGMLKDEHGLCDCPPF